ncbi:DotA/TraY family protein [Azospirillum sp. RWY-5-1]|uniref:DotA/TraY family protein n=1 Tax=Azospirillum oleiclasticum TaxID=2735135 RepID=A0ABX2T811_9PROT|nr:DotA/TraY family protein [Azospirillum oleiclasticum]NYZ13284.1 DotA/TraY family protein [Azospirillum oleiclasticum]NYZ20445.1 DotA/TraY family protein [Azospirillum oleiclasticum]
MTAARVATGRHGPHLAVVYLLLLAIIILGSLGVGVAFAEALGGDAAADTLPLQWLRSLVGDHPTLGGGGGGSTAVTVVLERLNATVLALAGVLLGYVIVRGVVIAAGQGRALGDGVPWLAPIRCVVALALLVPLPGGLSGSQAVILGVARLADSLGDAAWGGTLDRLHAGTTTVTPEMVVIPDAMVRAVLSAATCAATANAALGSAYVTLDVEERATTVGATTGTTTVMRWGGKNGLSGIAPDACGSVSWSSAIGRAATPGQQALARLDAEGARAFSSAISSLVSDLSSLGAQGAAAVLPPALGGTGEGVSSAEISRIVAGFQARYTLELQNAVNRASPDAEREWRDEAKRAGWTHAGLWFRSMSVLQSQVVALAQRQPGRPSPPSYAGLPPEAMGLVGRAVRGVDAAYAASRPAGAPDPAVVGQSIQTVQARAGGAAGAATTGTALEGEIVGYVGDRIRGLLSSLTLGADPVGSLGKIGGVLVAAGSGTALAVAVAAAVPIAGNGVLAAMGLVYVPSLLLVGAGMTLGVVVPTMPLVLWLWGVMGWGLSIAEALAGAPLWLMGHISLEGEGIEGAHGGHGYLLALNVLLRPLLMVLAFFAAVLLLTPLTRYVGDALLAGISLVSPDSLVGLVMMTGYVVMYAAVMVAATYAVFGMINSVPERSLAWIGGTMAGGGMDHDRAAVVLAPATAPGRALPQNSPLPRGARPPAGAEANGGTGSMTQHVPPPGGAK